MNDILSQAEIDKLLCEMSGDRTEETGQSFKETIKNYDFKTANRFTKEQIRAINLVFKNLGHLLSNYLMGTLRANCEAEVISIEEMSFNEFNNSVPSPAVIAIVNSSPFTGSLILEMTKEISYTVIGRILGGKKELPSEGRQFTEIELAIAERVLWQMIRNMDEAWAKMMKVDSALDRIETSMQYAQIVDINEPVLLVTLNITVDSESGLIAFCLPHQALEPFTKMLSTKLLFTTNSKGRIVNDPLSMKKSIAATEIVVSSVFNPTEATIRDIMSLHVGDVIRLQHKVGDPLIVKYQHIPKYRASLGKYRNNLAVKILDVIKGDEEHE